MQNRLKTIPAPFLWYSDTTFVIKRMLKSVGISLLYLGIHGISYTFRHIRTLQLLYIPERPTLSHNIPLYVNCIVQMSSEEVKAGKELNRLPRLKLFI